MRLPPGGGRCRVSSAPSPGNAPAVRGGGGGPAKPEAPPAAGRRLEGTCCPALRPRPPLISPSEGRGESVARRREQPVPGSPSKAGYC